MRFCFFKSQHKKVGFFDKYLLLWMAKILSIIFGITTTILTFLDTSSMFRRILFGIIIFISIIIYIYKWHRANILSCKRVSINYNEITLKTDNIFNEKYVNSIKIIPFNEFFDTEISDHIISGHSLNGIFIHEMLYQCVYKDINDLDNHIENETKNKTICKLLSSDERRDLGGKRSKYELGSLCYLKDNYCLLAFTRFDKNNNAYLTNKDYIYSLLNMWDNLNKSYNQRDIVIPLLGGGITRFRESNSGNAISNQELLKMILTTLKWSNKKFNCTITILIPKTNNEFKQINLFDIQETYKDL